MDGSFVRRISSPSTSTVSNVSSPPRPRPNWPWHAHTHSVSFASPTANPPIALAQWDAGSSTSTNTWAHNLRPSAASTRDPVTQGQLEDTIRQWNFTAFEWSVRDVRALRDFVEQGQLANAADGSEAYHEVLRESPMLGDSKLKLEIVRTSIHEPEPANATPTPSSPSPHDSGGEAHTKPTLSLCVTPLIFDHAQETEYDVTMMVAVKAQDDRGTERGARANWIWEHWETDWSFRQDNEVWECTLPHLSSLLENPRIAETDSFVICIQIHSPVGLQFPQHPTAHYAPRDLLDGIEASLDNPNTGDVKFICLELLPQSSSPASPLIPTTPSSHRSSSETSGLTHSMARKRVIYAHSDILIRRSDYFHTMLTSSFSEKVTVSAGDRKMYEIIVEEADFVTIYWLLKYCYANWVSFKENDDPRTSVYRMGEGWSTRWLNNSSGGEWDWKTFRKPGMYDDTSAGSREDDSNEKSVRSAESSLTGKTTSSASQGKRSYRSATSTSGGPRVSTVPSSPGQGTRTDSSRLTTPRRTGTQPGASTTSSQGASASSKSSAGVPRQSSARTSSSSLEAPQPQPPAGSGAYATYPLSPRQTRHGLTLPPLHGGATADPHPHPTSLPLSASALSIWLTAHRYAMPGLSSLALTHMMNTIQPSTAFSLLLATSRWDELHTLVEDYIVDQWDLACNSEEFEQCCQEVAAGVWGAEGGRTFATLFRRLRSR